MPAARRLPFALLLLGLAATVACRSHPIAPAVPSPILPTAQPPVPIMAAARLSAPQLVAWFNGRASRPAGSYAATVPIEALARLYIEEGAAEGVSGDVAFVQSVVETAWFRFTGAVAAASNNFAGIGATDASPAPAVFPDARTGVRAQIQHLRAYADPSAVACSVPPLTNPCVDPRFALVLPKGKAPTWNQLGSGNWATAPTYATAILELYAEALAFAGTR